MYIFLWYWHTLCFFPRFVTKWCNHFEFE